MRQAERARQRSSQPAAATEPQKKDFDGRRPEASVLQVHETDRVLKGELIAWARFTQIRLG